MGTTKQIAQMGLLLALAIVLKSVAFYIPIFGVLGIRVGFMDVVVAASGAFFGPLSGMVFGVFYDLLAYLVFPTGGPYFPGFTISFALVGVLGGLFLHKRLAAGKETGYRRCIALFVVIALTVDLVLNTLWLSMLTGKAFLVLLPPRLLAKAVMVPVNAYVLLLFVKFYRKVKSS